MELLHHKDRPAIKARIANYLKNPDTYALVLVAILLDNYGTEWLSWEIDTIELELQDDFYVDLPRINLDKIQALMTTMTSDTPYHDWMALNMVCEALNDNNIDADSFDSVTPEELAWGLAQMAMVEDNDSRPEFSSEVRKYMGVILAEHGITNPPDLLRLAIMPEQMENHMAGDPFFSRAIADKKAESTAYIMDYLKEQMNALIEQLSHVPLANRDNEAWNKIVNKLG